MAKILGFLLFIFPTLLMANSLVMTHADFVHLTDEQKNQYIIQTMELMAEIESKYQYAIVQEGDSSPQAQRYSLILKEMRSLLLSEAHADEYDANMDSIISLPISGENTKCFYAGWMSRIVTINIKGTKGTVKKSVCTHPMRLPKNSPEYQAYTKVESCPRPGSAGQEMISCNPAIFDFKQDSKKNLFCVPGGLAKSDNSAYRCMQLALDETKKTDTDARNERLKRLRNRFESNKDVVTRISQFVVRTCLCNDRDKINNDYLDSVRPHRTCYGMLKTLSETVSCDVPVADQNIPMLQKLKDFALKSSLNGPGVDQAYTSFLNEHTTEIKEACGPQKTPEKKPVQSLSCKAECRLGDDEKISCHYDPQDQLKSTRDPESKDKKAIMTLKDGKDIECETVFAEKSDKFSCKVSSGPSEGNADKFLVSATVEPTVDPSAVKFKWSNGLETHQAEFDKSQGPAKLTVTISENGKTETTTCEGKLEVSEEDKDKKNDELSLKVNGKESADKVDLDAEVKPKMPEGGKIIWFKKGGEKVAPPKNEKPKDSIAQTVGDEEPKKDKRPEEEKDPKKEDEAKEKGSQLGTGEKISAKRESTDYHVCAYLHSSDDKVLKGPECKKIPKKFIGPVGPARQGGPTYRPTSNTSAGGIL